MTKMKLKDFIYEIKPGSTAIILRGIPGSGKSTVVEKIRRVFWTSNIHVSSADEHRMVNDSYVYDPNKNGEVHAACRHDFEEVASIPRIYRRDILICDNTNISCREILPYYEIAEEYHWCPIVLTIDIDPIKAFMRNKHGVPEEKVLQMYNKLKQVRLPEYWAQTTIEGE